VDAEHGYFRHGHSYAAQTRDSAKVSRKKLMFAMEEDEENDREASNHTPPKIRPCKNAAAEIHRSRIVMKRL